MAHWLLRDMDNRGDDGDVYEIVGTPKRLLGYLDGPVRRDLRGLGAEEHLKDLMDAYNREDLKAAQQIGPQLSIYTYLADGEV